MKTSNVILSVLLNTCIIANTPAPLSYDQAAKLMESAWKEPPLSIDITFNLTSRDNTKTEEELQQMYEEAHKDIFETTGELNQSMMARREKFIRLNVDNFLKEQREGRKVKWRIRFDGNRLRLDEAIGSQEMATMNRPDGEITPRRENSAANDQFETSTIEVTDQNGVAERYMYDYKDKHASREVMPNSTPWDNDILKFTLSPAATFLRMKLGVSRGGSGLDIADYSPDPSKFDQLRANAVDGLSVNIEPDANEPDMKDRVNLIFYAGEEKKPQLETILVCDKQDYAKVYYYELRIPGSGKRLYTRVCSNFDDQGYPHNVTVTEYEAEEKIGRQKIYRIEIVELNIQIPDEVYRFSPPEGYMVYDHRLTPVVQEAAEIAHLKELLTHESTLERYKAFNTLSHILNDKPEELRDIAIVMKDDTSPQIRQVAETILRNIEVDRSDTE